MEGQPEPDLEVKKLSSFRGSENYHRLMGGVRATDGVHYIMQNGYSWFVNDAVAVLKLHARLTEYLSHDDFVVVELRLLRDKKARMSMEDGNGHELYGQTYEYSDAKVALKLFYAGGVLMLAGEY